MSGLHRLTVHDMADRADRAGADLLRLENLDTDIPPPAAAIAETQRQVALDSANSYLPFLGSRGLREGLAVRMGYPVENIVVTASGTCAILNVLLALLQPGDEVILTDPIYVGIVNRVRLARARPVFVPQRFDGERWRLDLEALRAAARPSVKMVIIVDPAMPNGALLDDEEWRAIGGICTKQDIPLLYDAAYQRVVYGGRVPIDARTLPGMRELTITAGSASKECRMIGWRVGWLGVPDRYFDAVSQASMANVVTPVGIAQAAVEVALRETAAEFAGVLDEWRARRDLVMQQLDGLRAYPADGGWSLLWDVRNFAADPETICARLLNESNIAVTPMTGWGDEGRHYVRIVFSNEPQDRLRTLRSRMAPVLASLGVRS